MSLRLSAIMALVADGLSQSIRSRSSSSRRYGIRSALIAYTTDIYTVQWRVKNFVT